MPTVPGTAPRKPCRWRTVSTCCRTWPRCWDLCSPPMLARCAMSSGPGARRLSPSGVSCRYRPLCRKQGPGFWLSSGGSGVWPGTRRSGRSTARAGRGRRSRPISASDARPSTASCAARPFLSARAAATPDTACSTRGGTSSSSTGTALGGTAPRCSESCSSAAIEAATRRSCATCGDCRGHERQPRPRAGRRHSPAWRCSQCLRRC
jgi:hypothetical protein